MIRKLKKQLMIGGFLNLIKVILDVSLQLKVEELGMMKEKKFYHKIIEQLL